MHPAPVNAVGALVGRVRVEVEATSQGRREAFEQVLKSLQLPNSETRAWRDGLDVVGSAYEQLFSAEERRSAGQFFTPFWAGDVMAGWVFEDKVELVLDPGCGSGGLLIPAARHPKRNGAQLLGIDVDPLAVLMLETNARLHALDGIVAREGNFLLNELEFAPQAILCNPPYSRHHVIAASDKAAIHDGFQARLGRSFSRLAALHVLFLVRAIEVAADGARIAFITPSDWLDVCYGKAIKEFLLERSNVEAIILFEESQLFFDGVLTTAAITLIRKGEATGEATTVVRLTGELPPPSELLQALAGEDGGEVQVESVRLSTSEKWSRPRPKVRSGKTLGSVAVVRRGIATGANSFFVLSEASRKQRGIPREELKRCVPSPRAFNGTELTEELFELLSDDVPRWLIDSDDQQLVESDTPLGRYLKSGEDGTLKINEGYLASRRTPWYRLERRGKSPILFTYFNRARPRFIRNRAGAVPLNNWLIIEPLSGTDPDRLFRALQATSVREQLDDKRRVYGGGLWKLEPSELLEVRIRGRLGS